ncbi:MAG: GldG family protein [Gammaproteobacteria bacterium]
MKSRSRLLLRLQSVALVAVLLALAGFAAWASLTWSTQADWTQGHRNSLSTTTHKLLATLDEPVTISAFVRPDTALSQKEHQLLERYRHADSRIRLRFVNPDTALEELRKLGITTVGELYVSYGKRGEKLDDVSESGISNALLRLARGAEKQVLFVSGHGEASPVGKRNYDLGNFGAALERQGFRIATRNLADDPELGDKVALVVIAGPQLDLLPREVKALEHWLVGGGNLLWLHNPGPLHGLAPLAQALGIQALAGTVVSGASKGFGAEHPTALVVSDYGASAITRGLDLNTLFPDATGFKLLAATGSWTTQPFVQSPRFPASWLMIGGPGKGRVLYRPGTDVPGPVPIAIALTRARPDGNGRQRVAVVGNTNFLANSFLGNGGNLNLGLRLFNWLTGEDHYLDIAPAQAPDRRLALSRVEQGGIGFGFLVFLPLVFLVVALALALRRRRR